MAKVVGKVKGKIRLQLIRFHRLSVFERTFDKFLKGEVPAKYLSARAKKLKEVK